MPTLTPTGAVQVLESSPVITASYSAEAGEYVGDTHLGASLILATFDGVQVAPLMSTLDSGATWTLKTTDVQPDGLANGVHIFQITAVDAAGNTHALTQTVFEVFVDPTLPEPVVETTPEENTTPEPPTEDATPSEDAQPVEGSSDEANASATTDPGVPEGSTPDAQENVDDVISDPPAEQIGEPAPDTTGETAAPEDVEIVEAPADTAPANSVDFGVEVTPETESTPVESTDATDSDIADPTEPIRDLIFDRLAEQVGFESAGAGSSSGSSSGGTSSSDFSEEGGGTVLGCNLPLGNSNVVGGEYALLGFGLLGLGLRRPAGALRDMLWPGREATVTPDADESD